MTDLKGILKILVFCACCLVGTQSASAQNEACCLPPDAECVTVDGCAMLTPDACDLWDGISPGPGTACDPGICDPVAGCTLTPGFWKNHSQLITEDTLLCEETWIDILNTPPRRGNAFYILAHQWIAAELNVADGADRYVLADFGGVSLPSRKA